jgi:streptomycin 6-kinase
MIESGAMSQPDARALTVPTAFRDALVRDLGERAREWLDRLPELVGDLLERWSCIIAGPAMSGWKPPTSATAGPNCSVCQT